MPSFFFRELTRLRVQGWENFVPRRMVPAESEAASLSKWSHNMFDLSELRPVELGPVKARH